MANSVLLIDDDADVLRSIGNYFERLGYEVTRELSGESGLTAYDRVHPEVVVVDLKLPGMDGLEVLEHLRERDAAVILLTGHSDVPTAVKAMQLGAENFLTKPVDMAHLAAATARAADKVRLRRVNAALLAQGGGPKGLESLGTSPPMQEIRHRVELLARSDRTTVLIEGESGSGKGWVARMIHDLSSRGREAFIEVNCAGLSAAFLDGELFGQEGGGPDGAARREGAFELADRGTLFLDEIADLAPELQPKLLKVLETKTFRRVGGSREVTVDVRLVAATNRNLHLEVESGRFREDLFYRLSVMPLRLPALRDRTRDDRLALLTRIVADLRAELPDAPDNLSADAVDRLLQYSWPGNVREMRNVLERALILARGQGSVATDHLPADLRLRATAGERRHTPITIEDLERQHIERTLRYHGGNRTRAAQELGISRATLINKIKRYGFASVGVDHD